MRPILHQYQVICLEVALTKKRTRGLKKTGFVCEGEKDPDRPNVDEQLKREI